MTDKILLTVGLIWLGGVVLWLRSAHSFFLMLGRGKGAKVSAYILAYSFQAFVLVFIVGWIIPLALGIYRLIRKH